MTTGARPRRRRRTGREVVVAPRSIVLFVGVAVAAILLLGAAWISRAILVQLFVAVVLALSMEPLVQLLERRGVRRGAAVGVSFALVVVSAIALAYVLFKPFVQETTGLAHDAPHLVDELSRGHGDLGFLEQRFHVVERVQAAVDSGRVSATAGPAWAAVSGALHTGEEIVFVVFLSVFVQLGGRAWFEALVALVPGAGRARVRRTGDRIAAVIAGYVTGNLLISVIAGTVTTVTLYATSVPYAITLGVLVAVFDLVPLVGATIGTVAVATVALATQGVVTTAVVVAVMVVYQQVENHFLQHLVYHRTVKLSPLAIALSVALGAELGGVVGALLGIPVAGALKVVSSELLAWRQGEEVQGAGRRGSSEDDLPLQLNRAPDRGTGRGLNPMPDERRPARSRV